MKSHHNLSQDVGANAAGGEAIKGAAIGSAKWGAPFAALWVIGNATSPVYRGLTLQFKVFIQMSGMILGGYLEADRRVRFYEQQARMRHKLERDYAARKKWERFVDDEDHDDHIPTSPLKEPKDGSNAK